MKNLWIIFVLCSAQIFSQSHGTTQIVADNIITELINKFHRSNRANPSIDGYRIQIIQHHKSDLVNENLEAFQEKFPEYNTYVLYHQPYFKLRAGNFTTKYKGYKALKAVRRYFDSAFLVQEEIRLNELRY